MRRQVVFKMWILTTLILVVLFGGPVIQENRVIWGENVQAASYSGDYRYWSQGASDDYNMRQYGCWVTAQAKLLYETNVDRSAGFNPDSYLNWQRNNGLINSGFYQTNGGNAPSIYASQKGKKLTYLGNWNADANQLWFNINAGYYTIVRVPGHYVMLANQLSKEKGTLYCYDSWTPSSSVAPQPLSRYSSWISGYVYRNDSSDSTPPSISNVRITNIDANGYTVTCNVSDNVGIDRVEFPSWNTDKHRGEDANWIRGSVSGNTASARISLSSLKSGAVQGNYVTHIYAWDTSGNKTGVPTSVIYIDRTAPTLTDVKIVEKDSQGYVVECKASDASGIDRVQFPTWTARNSQDDLAPNWGINTAVKGTATGNTYRFRVNISDHNNEHGDYITHVYVYDKYGNSACASTHTKVIMGYVPQKITRYDNSLLAVYDENASWESLKTIAKQMGSSLVEISDAKKQAAVTDLVSDQHRLYYNIGGYQSAKGQPWKWLSGADVTYTNWEAGQPDCAGNNEFYLSVISGHGRWNDLTSNYGWSGFIVETPLDMKADAQMEYNGKIYKFYKAALPYATAERFCKETGGSLVKIETKEENAAITQKIKEIKGSFYIGASDEEKEGTFVWRDGTALTYSNWSSGEPNNSEGAGAENYAVIYENGQWNDLYGWDAAVGFIAEYDKKTEPVATPTPVPTVKPSSGNGDLTSSSKDTENDQITQEDDDDILDEDDEDNEIEKVSKGKVLWAKNLKKRKMKVKVKNLSEADYYEIVCGTNKSCTKGKKKFITSKRTVVFKRLKKKTYYVKVRGYYYHGKTKVMGEWSKVKKVKVKK